MPPAVKLRCLRHLRTYGMLFAGLHAVSPAEAAQAPAWYLPDYAEVQYAGNLGFLAVGAGKSFRHEKIQVGGFYGIVPPAVGSKTVHTLALKTTLRPYIKRLPQNYAVTPFYLGAAWIYTLGEEFRMNDDKPWPEDYYPRAAFHVQPYIGIAVEGALEQKPRTARAVGAYLEVGALFDDIDREFHSQHFLSLNEILNLAVGVTVRFF